MNPPIASMNSGELLARVRRNDLDEPEVLEVLRNPYCTVEIAQLIADSRVWTTSYKVRERLAGTAGMPFARAANLIGSLPWLSLLQLAQEPSTPPVVRRHAEKKLLEKVGKMTLGEKVALARRAHRPLFMRLIATNDGAVLDALLDNPRIVETNVVVMINTGNLPEQLYRSVARHPRWGLSYGVRLALAQSPGVALPISLSALVQLKTQDLDELATLTTVRLEVREAAAALARRKRTRPRSARGLRR